MKRRLIQGLGIRVLAFTAEVSTAARIRDRFKTLGITWVAPMVASPVVSMICTSTMAYFRSLGFTVGTGRSKQSIPPRLL